MEKIIIKGGRKLCGEVAISGSKNSVLPIIIAALLTEEKCVIQDVPDLADVQILCELLNTLGVKTHRTGSQLTTDCSRIEKWEAPYEYVTKMRASVLLMGPLLARLGKVSISLPGGCAIGTRPIDLHLKGFEALGAVFKVEHGNIEAKTDGLIGNRIYLDFPSVGATENILMAAVLAEGTTIIENAAEEPEIVDLSNFLNKMGGKIKGAGTSIIRVEGVSKLHGVEHTVIPDRIEIGTFLVAAAITGGEVLLKNVIIDHLKPVIAKLREAGSIIEENGDSLRIIAGKEIIPVDLKTLPYPGFPTDMQAQFMALMAFAEGTSIITETVFENRFMHADELKRMGADIRIEGRTAVIEGTKKLAGCQVRATDLRAGAAMIIAALAAEGDTEITEIVHIDRGYEDIVCKLSSLGADIKRV